MTTEEKVFLLAELLGQLITTLTNVTSSGFERPKWGDYYHEQLDKILNDTYS